MEVGFDKLLKTVSSKNTCKTCAFGMGGQRGGMTNEVGDTLEICKKSFQAHISDLKPPIPNELFQNKKIEDFKKISGRDMERLGRLNTPLIKEIGSEYYKPINWEEAFNRVVQQMKLIQPKRSFFYVSGRASNEAGYILQLFARLFGTSNINNSSYYCHQASGVGITNTLGSGSATLQLADLKEADTIFVIGANPASNHPRYLKQLVNCRRRGGNIIVINPLQERGLIDFILPQSPRSYLGDSKIATEYLQIKVGGDIALLKGIAKYIIERGEENRDFINRFTNDFEQFRHDIINQSWEQICQDTGIPQQQIEKIAQIYSKSKNAIFSWGMGITQHQWGVDNVEYIVNLALLKGQLAKRFSGLLPLRGHSNIQGIGSIGVKPYLQEIVFKNLEEKMNCKLPRDAGLDTLACLQASFNRQIDFAWIQGGNLFCSTPDSIFAERALSQIPYKVFLTNTLNHTHIYGANHEQLILPVLTRDEESQSTTQESMFNYVRLSDGQIKRLDNAKSEVDIIQNIASKIVPKKIMDFEIFQSHKTIRKAISQTIPGFEKMSTIDDTKEEFQIQGRTFYEPKFYTHNGKANFATRKTPVLPALTKDNQFIMTTVRSEGQYNTIIYEFEDIYRGQTERYIVLMNPKDMQKLGLQENSFVSLSNDEIAMQYFKVRPFEIKEGNIAAYYPEINYLVPAKTDPRSHTPTYKSFKVNVIPIDSRNAQPKSQQPLESVQIQQ